MTLAACILLLLIVIMLGAIYQAVDRCAHALGRLALTAERWSGDWRTAMMFPDDPPHPAGKVPEWPPDATP